MANNTMQPIEYTLTRTSRKNVNITVKNDGVIHVSAPKRVALADINKIVLSKREWILNAQKNIKSKKIIKNDVLLRNNASVYLYGTARKLLIVPCMKNFVAINGNTIVFYVKEEYSNDQKYKSSFFNKSLKIELMKDINKFANKYLKLLNLSLNEIELRAMKTRWGTCIPAKKKILFNSKLVHCPYEAIEYVVLHEIAHLVHPNHSKAFYALIEQYMPDWKERKNLLQDYLIK
ncbi:MAG: M48 family metallopeptidase [Clostridia bacterium]|nr:M48 family metallopeptidase [Clostridia bacterium]